MVGGACFPHLAQGSTVLVLGSSLGCQVAPDSRGLAFERHMTDLSPASRVTLHAAWQRKAAVFWVSLNPRGDAKMRVVAAF